MEPSDRISDLYKHMYADGVEKAWRDAGAVDKAGNIARIYRRADLPESPRVVELGCGEGAIVAALASHDFGAEYTGFDLSESGIQEAQDRGIPGASFVLVVGDGMPIGPDSADLALLCHVVEHLEHPRSLIYEAQRIAKFVIVEVPLELNARLPRDYALDALGHINKYTAKSIRQLLQSCDLEIVDQFTTNPSRGQALFRNTSRKRLVEWRIKEYALRYAPVIARSLFTYHETLLAKRRTA